MTPIEAGQLLLILAAATDREPSAGAAHGWSFALEDLPYAVGEEALKMALRSPDSGYITPQVIRKHAQPILRRIAQDVRSAKLRGLVAKDWPDQQPLPAAVAEALTAEWFANNDREALPVVSPSTTKEIDQ